MMVKCAKGDECIICVNYMLPRARVRLVFNGDRFLSKIPSLF